MLISQLRKSMKKRGYFAFMNFGAHAEKPKGRIMATDKIIWINVINKNRELQKVAAWEGEPLLLALKRSDVTGIPGI